MEMAADARTRLSRVRDLLLDLEKDCHQLALAFRRHAWQGSRGSGRGGGRVPWLEDLHLRHRHHQYQEKEEVKQQQQQQQQPLLLLLLIQRRRRQKVGAATESGVVKSPETPSPPPSSPSAEEKELEAKKLKERAASMFKQKNFSRALEFCDAAIRLQPLDATHRANRSLALLRLERYGDAAAAAEDAIVRNPSWAKGHFRLGSALQARAAAAAAAAAEGGRWVSTPSADVRPMMRERLAAAAAAAPPPPPPPPLRICAG